jgi:hypothetical protein
MAKVDDRALVAGLTGMAALAAFLRVNRSSFLRLLGRAVLCFIGLELVLVVVGGEVLGSLWWAIHLPSALLLGVDEILERNGLVVSTLAHFADLLLWSAVAAAALSIQRRRYAVASNR